MAAKEGFIPKGFLVPYFLYADDFGINNPIGSKSNKHSVCNFYNSFPCVPKTNSKLNEVFLACTIKSIDIKMHKNDCYANLVNTIKKMEVYGIRIKTKSGTKNVRFIMGLLLGDNLGLNNILGFSKSFSANLYCRFCLVKKCDAQAQYAENKHMLRNRMNYTVCTAREVSLEIGISSECVFNNVPSFHCTENFAVDIMHDVFEGVCHHVLCKSLLFFMKIMRFFNIDTLNNSISHFVYEDN